MAACSHGVVGFLMVPCICLSKQALWVELPLKKDRSKFQSLVLVNAALFRNRVFADITGSR